MEQTDSIGAHEQVYRIISKWSRKLESTDNYEILPDIMYQLSYLALEISDNGSFSKERLVSKINKDFEVIVEHFEELFREGESDINGTDFFIGLFLNLQDFLNKKCKLVVPDRARFVAPAIPSLPPGSEEPGTGLRQFVGNQGSVYYLKQLIDVIPKLIKKGKDKAYIKKWIINYSFCSYSEQIDKFISDQISLKSGYRKRTKKKKKKRKKKTK
jgi:hypothetical protein